MFNLHLTHSKSFGEEFPRNKFGTDRFC